MGRIVAGIGSSHVPSVGAAFDQGKQDSPEWKPLFDGYRPAMEWLREARIDVAVFIYNDHGTDFFFDKYPTFAMGVADSYPPGDEGWGPRPLPHHEYMRQGGAEAVEMIMWLGMRGALSPQVKLVHRNYYAPMLTGMGLLLLEDAAG